MRSYDKAALGARLRAERKARGLTVADMARRWREVAPPHVRRRLPKLIDLQRTIRSHESGTHSVGERNRFLWSRALDIPEAELFPSQQEPPDPLAGSVEVLLPTHARDDMERRALLLAALGLTAGTLGSSGEAVRQLIALDLPSEPRDIENWHLTCNDHLYALRNRPPAEAREGIAIDLLALHRQMREPGPVETVELHRVLAALSTLHANVLTRLGDHSAAIHWWRTAKAAADATGDLELRLGVRATEAGHARYGQRQPTTVLRLTEDALGMAGQAPSLGRALVLCSHAKALSLLGRDREALAALNDFRDASETAPRASGIMPSYWEGGQLPFAELTVHAEAGLQRDVERAATGALAVLERTSDQQYIAQVHLNSALCVVINGGVDTGVRQAIDVLGDLTPPQRTSMTLDAARTVLRAVPADQRDRPTVRDLQVLTSGSVDATPR